MNRVISVIIPAASEKENLLVLQYLKKVDYPKDKIEVILAIGNNPPAQRNKAVEIAKGDILYFFNVDAQFTPDLFKNVIEIFNKDERIAGVGGPDLTPSDNNYIQHLFGYAMSSYFAHWKMRARYSQVGKERVSDERELVLSNLAIRRDIYLKTAGFNKNLYPNEENELINRILKMGYKFIYSPDAKIYRNRRKTIFRFMKQFYNYGKGRMNQIFTERSFKNLYFLIPIFLLTYISIQPFIGRNWISFMPLFAYIIVGIGDAFYISFKSRQNLVFQLFLVYSIMHISYAIGMISKFSNILLKGKNIKNNHAEPKIEKVKILSGRGITITKKD